MVKHNCGVRVEETFELKEVDEDSSTRANLQADDAGRMNARRRAAWSTFGPHAIGSERFATVSSGSSLRRSPM
jgi:hypothetical protein